MASSVISEFLPGKEDPEINRDNILDAIESDFLRGADLIWLEGSDGSGRSNCLRQFAHRHAANAIALFVSNKGRWSMDWELLRFDLIDQISHLIDATRLQAGETSDSMLNGYLMRLIRFCRRRTEPFYFVIDGIEELPADRLYIRDTVYETLPLNISNCKFLISCPLGGTARKLNAGVQKQFPAIPFNMTECQVFLGPVLQDSTLLDEIRNTSKGHPGHLAAIRRVLDSKSAQEQREITSRLPDELPKLFAIEWESCPRSQPWHEFALAIIAMERRSLVRDLASYLKLSSADIRSYLAQIRFIEISPKSESVSFVSESFRAYAEKRLGARKVEVTNLVIDNLLCRPDEDISFTSLPGYLAAAGRNEELLAYLSPERVQQILTRSDSAVDVLKKTDVAIKGAALLKRDGDLLRLGTLKSALADLEKLDTWRAEVEARIALGDYNEALAIAEGSRLKEHRLRMLAVVAHKLVEEGKNLPPEIVTQIRALYAAVDASSLDSCEMELASDLLCAAPEIAVALVERSKRLTEERDRDMAFAQLSLMAAAEDETAGDRKPPVVQSLTDHIQDTELRNITEAAQVLVGGYSVEKVLNETARLAEAREQLFLLRQWLQFNRDNEQGWRVSAAGLKLIIKAAESPNASVLADFAEPIAHCPDSATRAELIAAFDAQRAYLERVGPSEDFVRLQLLLSSAEISHDRPSAVRRLLDVYFFAEALGDPSTRVLSFTHIERFIASLPAIPELAKERISEVLSDEISKGVAALLADTADHYQALAPVLKRIASYDAARAHAYCLRLNTPVRRQRALLDVALSALREAPPDFEAVWSNIATSLVGTAIGDEFLVQSLRALTSRSTWSEGHIGVFKQIESTAAKIADAEKRCFACCRIVDLYGRNTTAPGGEQKEVIIKLLRDTWTSIDQAWLKAEVAYRVAGAIGGKENEIARAMVDEADALRKAVGFHHPEKIERYLTCVMLAIRAFGGLLGKGTELDADVEKLGHLIRAIPSSGDQANMWAQVAVRCFLARQKALGDQIVAQHIKPCLASISDADTMFKWTVTEYVSVALYGAHQASAFEVLKTLPDAMRNSALSRIATFIWRKSVPDDPYDEVARNVPQLAWEELLELCILVDRLSDDAAIYRVVRMIADVLSSKHGRVTFNATQRNDLWSKLARIVGDKLPSANFTAHEGYRIICDAQVSRIIDDRSVYSALLARTRLVPNVADRAFIYTVLSGIIREPTVAGDCVRLAREATASIPVDMDRIEHYLHLATEMDGVTPKDREQCMRKALMEAFTSDRVGIETLRRRVLDLLHTYEPERRDELTSFLDDDPARSEKRLLIESKLREVDIRKELADVERLPTESTLMPEHVAAAWQILGSLNAHRAATVSPDKVRCVLAAASRLPLHDAYAVLSWAIENHVRKYRDAVNGQKAIRPLFDGCLTTAQVLHWLCTSGSRGGCTEPNITYSGGTSLFISAGASGDATRYIQDWLKEDNGEFYIICDPYFSHEDLKILLLFKETVPGATIDVITARTAQRPLERGISSIEEQYRTWWRVNVCADECCETRVVIASFRKDGKSPIHDRWILGRKTGLRLGTSLNSLGVLRLSELSLMSTEDVTVARAKLEGFITRRVRFGQHGDRIDYTEFSM